MSEIRRNPTIEIRGGKEYVTFDEDHTLADFVRYLLTETDRDELLHLLDVVGAPCA